MKPAAGDVGSERWEQERIRILFVIIQMAMGGAERLVLNLIRNLDRNRFEPSLAWFVQGKPLTEFAELGIPLHYIPKGRGFDARTMQAVSRIVRRERIDVINAHHFMPVFYSYYAARIAGRARLVYTEHSESDVLNVAGFWRIVGARLIASCDGVIGVSSKVSSLLIEHLRLQPDKVQTIENGVDLELFDASPEERAAIRHQLGLSLDKTVIGTVANLRRNKNHVFLLRAFAEICRVRSDVHLVLVGQGFPGDPESSESEIANFLREARLEANVSVLGYRPDVRDVLRAMDIFCLVSYREGLPVSLIEAMATGLPLVGTAVEGIRNVVQQDINGLLVSPDDVAGLTGALSRLITDTELRKDLGAAARRLAREKYSLRRCVDETERLFQSLVSNDRPRCETVPVRH